MESNILFALYYVYYFWLLKQKVYQDPENLDQPDNLNIYFELVLILSVDIYANQSEYLVDKITTRKLNFASVIANFVAPIPAGIT